MARALSKPAVKVNNQPVAILPNTFKYNEGKGETKTRATSTGGGGIENVVSDSAEDKIGKCSFDMANTAENIKLANGWKNNPGENAIRVSEDSFSRVFIEMSVANDYEVELSTEGKFTLEWEGAQPQ